MSLASSRPPQRPKSKSQLSGRKHQDNFAFHHQTFHQHHQQHPVSTTTATFNNTSPLVVCSPTTITTQRTSPLPSPEKMSSYMTSDDSNYTISTSDITDAYDDADESQSFTPESQHHHSPNHHNTHHRQLAVSPPRNTTRYRSEDRHSAQHDDAMDPRHRVTHQRDQVAQQHLHAPDNGVNVTAPPHEQHQSLQVSKSPTAISSVKRQSASGIYSLTDDELRTVFEFGDCIGHGNWGQVWVCRPIDPDSGIGHASAMKSGMGGGGRVAIKLVERDGNPSATHCIRALWGEMKIIRGLRHEPHPSIINFEAFVICPTLAAVVMPLHKHPMPIPLPLHQGLRYFQQLSSAVTYLHDRGITHNDIKPANVVISYSDVAVLVDFGFAQVHKFDDTKRFLSTASWGTPEYLDPLRVMGQPHDERKSDVWSLGVTMYETLVGRTPFEMSSEEVFETQEELDEYLHRSRSGKWYGEYNIGDPYLERILQHMLYPDPAFRPPASEVYNAVCNIINNYTRSSIATPSFARRKDDSFDSFDDFTAQADRERERGQMEQRLIEKAKRALYEREREMALGQPQMRKLKTVQSEVLQRDGDGEVRAPTPLGESRKQTSSTSILRPAKSLVRRARTPVDQENVFYNNYQGHDVRKERVATESPKANSSPKAVRPRYREDGTSPERRDKGQEGKQPRATSAEHKPLARPVTASGAIQYKPLRRSSFNVGRPAQEVPVTLPKTREEALAATMRSLQANSRRSSTSPSKLRERPSSAAADYAREYNVYREQQHRPATRLGYDPESPSRVTVQRSPSRAERPLSRLAHPRLADVAEDKEVLVSFRHSRPTTPTIQISPARVAPQLDVDISTSSVFSFDSLPKRPIRTTSSELELMSKYRGPAAAPISPNRKAKQSTAPSAVVAADTALPNLDRLAEWAKRVELYVESARKAVAEGRAVPSVPGGIPDLEALGLGVITLDSPPPRAAPSRHATVSSRLEPTSMSSGGTSATSALLQTPLVQPAQLSDHGPAHTYTGQNDSIDRHMKEKTSLSKAASQTLKRHPVSQVFKRWGERHERERERERQVERGVISPEPQPKITSRTSEPQLDRRGTFTRHPMPSFQGDEGCETLDDGPPERVMPSRLGKVSSAMSLREAVKAAAAGMGLNGGEKAERNKTVPRRYGASPVAEFKDGEAHVHALTHVGHGHGQHGRRDAATGGGSGAEKEKRRMSLFKIFKSKNRS